MTERLTVWHGTADECTALMDALRHSGVTMDEARELLGNQRIVDRLLFVRRMAARYWQREWDMADGTPRAD